MKKLLALLAIVSFGSLADVNDLEEYKKLQACEQESQVAEAVKIEFYYDQPLLSALSNAIGDEQRQAMIVDAYDDSYYHTAEFQEREIQEFKNKYFLRCYNR